MAHDILFVGKWLSIITSIACAIMVLHDTFVLTMSWTIVGGWAMLALCVALSFGYNEMLNSQPNSNV